MIDRNGCRCASVLQVIESSASGSGLQVLLSTRELLRRGLKIGLAYSHKRADARFLGFLREIRDEFPNFSACCLPMHHSPHPSDIQAARALRLFFRNAGPFDFVHSHSTKAGLIAHLAFPFSIERHLHTPHAFLSMNETLSPLARTAVRSYEFFMSTITRTTIVVSEVEYEHARSLGIEPGRIAFVPNGIDVNSIKGRATKENREFYRTKLRLGAQDDVCFGFLGRLVPQKALGSLLEAFAMLMKQCGTSAVLVIVGEGPEESKLRALARSLQIAENVRFFGPSQGPSVMTAFDVFVLSSLYEGMPMSLLEALALGLPCAVTRTGGANELVSDGFNGFVTPVGDTQELAGAMAKLLTSLELRQRFGSNSCGLAVNFDIERTTDRFTGLLNQPTPKPKPRARPAAAAAE